MPSGATGSCARRRQPARPAHGVRRRRPRHREHDRGHLRLQDRTGESLFPRGIPIGRVSEADLDEVEIYQRVHLEPYADLQVDRHRAGAHAPLRAAPRPPGGPAVILSPGAFLRVGLLPLLAVVLQLSSSANGILGGHIDWSCWSWRRSPTTAARWRAAPRLRRRLPARPRERDDGRFLAVLPSATASGASARDPRPEPRPAAAGGRGCAAGGRWSRSPRCRSCSTSRQREPAGDPRRDRDHAAQHAARAGAGLRVARCCARR